MLKSGTGFDVEDIKNVKTRLEDSRVYSMETAGGFLSSLSSEWASCGADYSLEYEKNILKVGRMQITDFVEKYIKNKSGVAVVFVNPEYYEEKKEEFRKDGWQELNAQNARWWNSGEEK